MEVSGDLDRAGGARRHLKGAQQGWESLAGARVLPRGGLRGVLELSAELGGSGGFGGR